MCKWIPSLSAIVIAILALWPDLIGSGSSKWVIVILSLISLAHPYSCGGCGMSCECCEEMPKPRKRRK